MNVLELSDSYVSCKVQIGELNRRPGQYFGLSSWATIGTVEDGQQAIKCGEAVYSVFWIQF